MNNGKTRSGKELDSANETDGCTCGLCHKYKATGALALASEFNKEMEESGKNGVGAPAWTCSDSCTIELLCNGCGYGTDRRG